MATSHCIEPIYDVNITKEKVDEICRRHTNISHSIGNAIGGWWQEERFYPVRLAAHSFTAAITNGRRARFWQSWTPYCNPFSNRSSNHDEATPIRRVSFQSHCRQAQHPLD